MGYTLMKDCKSFGSSFLFHCCLRVIVFGSKDAGRTTGQTILKAISHF